MLLVSAMSHRTSGIARQPHLTGSAPAPEAVEAVVDRQAYARRIVCTDMPPSDLPEDAETGVSARSD